MTKIIRKQPKLIGMLLGLVQGVSMGLDIEEQQNFPVFQQNEWLIIIGFGLLAPPLLTVFSSLTDRDSKQGFFRKIPEYINFNIMMIVGCLSLGLTGLITLNNFDVNDGRVIVSFFFIAGGIGFVLASIVSNRLLQNN